MIHDTFTTHSFGPQLVDMTAYERFETKLLEHLHTFPIGTGPASEMLLNLIVENSEGKTCLGVRANDLPISSPHIRGVDLIFDIRDQDGNYPATITTRHGTFPNEVFLPRFYRCPPVGNYIVNIAMLDVDFHHELVALSAQHCGKRIPTKMT